MKKIMFGFAMLAASSAQADTFVVDRTDDTASATACTASANDCSLRGAVIAANANAGDDVITLPAGIYVLTVTGTGEDAGATGDLDVVEGAAGSVITINGDGAATTIIDGNGTDRVFHLPTSTSASFLTLNDLTVTNGNVVPGSGGGILSTQGDVVLSGVRVTANAAVAVGNSGGSGGGIFLSGGADLTATESLIDANTADLKGGGLNASGAVTLVNVTVSGNTSAIDGGGISVIGPAAKNFRNVTVTANTATNQGGGLLADNDSTSVILRNTILAGNFNDGVASPDCFNREFATLTTEGFNLIGDETGCDGNFSGGPGDLIGTAAAPVDAVLSQLSDNGGPTPTHALAAGSPALDAGNNVQGCTSDDAQTAVLTDDQRGAARPVDANGDGTVRCDIGAFELQQGALCGDGTRQSFEQCDDGNTVSGDGCSDTCAIEPDLCGNARLDNIEQCDDGNTTPGDGCSELCVVEPGFACVGTVCVAGCGDGTPAPPEECDDGNLVDGDGCSAACVVETPAFCAANPGDCFIVLVGDGGCGLVTAKINTNSNLTFLLILGNFLLLGGLFLVKRAELQ